MVTSLEKAISERETLKTTLTWLENQVKPDLGIEDVESSSEDLQSLKSSLTKVHVRIVECIPPDIADQETEYLAMRDRIKKLEITLKKMTNALTPATVPKKSKPKLPELILQSFSGEVTEWMPFRDMFINSVHNDADLAAHH